MQQYKNHVRYYTPHHFIFYPVVLLMLGICVKQSVSEEAGRLEWLMYAALTVMVCWLSFMMRQHYALNNQNRIVRLEMRLRYYQLTQKRFEIIEQQLSLKQITALRFAGDEELETLIQKTIKEQLSPDNIKRLISNWQPDLMRV